MLLILQKNGRVALHWYKLPACRADTAERLHQTAWTDCDWHGECNDAMQTNFRVCCQKTTQHELNGVDHLRLPALDATLERNAVLIPRGQELVMLHCSKKLASRAGRKVGAHSDTELDGCECA